MSQRHVLRVFNISLLRLFLLACPSALLAQALPPIRALGPVIHVSADSLLGSVSYVRRLPTGKVIVHDLSRRRVLMLDSSLAYESTLVDTNTAGTGGYSSRLGGVFPFRGDSTAFVDPASLTISIFDSRGAPSRTVAIPRPQDADLLIGGPFGTPGIDSSLALVFRGVSALDRRNATSAVPIEGQAIRMPTAPDSAPILRVGLESRRVDTVTFVRIPAESLVVTATKTGYLTTLRTSPLPVVDDWVLMADGSVAVVRGKDLRIEVFRGDQLKRRSMPVSYNWERLSDTAKVRIADSAMVEWRRLREDIERIMNGAVPTNSNGGRVDAETRFANRNRYQGPNLQPVEPRALPDYRPAFRQGALSADSEGNLWLRTTAPSEPGPLYIVLRADGTIIDRVRLPFGRVISGFGPGVVYMGVLDRGSARVEVARVR